MRLFECQCCAQLLFFENTKCERCEHKLGYIPDENRLVALEAHDDAWVEAGHPGAVYRFCANAEYGVCNWLVPTTTADQTGPYCAACRFNHLIPDLSQPGNLDRWRAVENAKHRLIYTLMRLRLPLPVRGESQEEGLAFDFLDEKIAQNALTGHDHGLITVNLAEAEDGERERRRSEMGEPYRTLLGHLRHEIGHYYWDLLVKDRPALEQCRVLFGDEQIDYSAALQSHYSNGAPPDWNDHFVSAYASAHPWEDFAETFAHYLHIVDTLETAHAFGLAVRPRVSRSDELSADLNINPHRMAGMDALVESWLPLCFAVNSLNRSMGQPDLYPFVLSPAAIAKLGFVRDLVLASAEDGPGAARHPATEPERAAQGGSGELLTQ